MDGSCRLSGPGLQFLVCWPAKAKEGESNEWPTALVID